MTIKKVIHISIFGCEMMMEKKRFIKPLSMAGTAKAERQTTTLTRQPLGWRPWTERGLNPFGQTQALHQPLLTLPPNQPERS